jgi:two-component system chemotaxis response regulator CheV
MAESEILLESGTNELEVLEFSIGDSSFGINVAKILEIIGVCDLKAVPYAHPCVEGVFNRRGEIYTVVDLAGYLSIERNGNRERDIFLITEFNQANVAFRVDAVKMIHHLSWTQIEEPDKLVRSNQEGIVTGIAKTGDKEGTMILILDFEKILFDISPETGISKEVINHIEEGHVSELPILIAEDSTLLRKLLLDSLFKAGFHNVVATTNGQEAWNLIESAKSEYKDIREKFACVITDIEMPQMDGLTLTKKIKDDPILYRVPVIIFSSIINDANSTKCTEVGADAQFSKPEVTKLVACIHQVIENVK